MLYVRIEKKPCLYSILVCNDKKKMQENKIKDTFALYVYQLVIRYIFIYIIIHNNNPHIYYLHMPYTIRYRSSLRYNHASTCVLLLTASLGRYHH